MSIQVISELMKLGAEASLPPVPAAKIHLAMETLSLSRDIFKTIMEAGQVKSEINTTSGYEYHQKIHPYLMMTGLIVDSTKLFMSIKNQLPNELKAKFETNFKTLLDGFAKFNQQVVDRLTEEFSDKLSPFDHAPRLGYYLSALAELSYSGGTEEQKVSQTSLAQHIGVSTAGATTIRDSLVKSKFAEEHNAQKPDDRRLKSSTITPLGWQALTFYQLRESMNQVKRISKSLE